MPKPAVSEIPPARVRRLILDLIEARGGTLGSAEKSGSR